MRKIFLTLLLIIFVGLGLEAQNTGLATFYGKKFNNRKTASGQIYRKDSMVCAHKTYPFGSLLRVRSLLNNKEIIVKVIDRGPFKKNRIIDLSYAAAKELDMVRYGIMKVEISEYMDEKTMIRSDSLDSLKMAGSR